MSDYKFEVLYTRLGKPVSITLSSSDINDLAKKVHNLRMSKGVNSNRSFQQTVDEVRVKATKGPVINKEYVKRPNKKKNLTLSQAIKGGLALVNIVKGDVVDDQELKRRAEVCATCPMLSDIAMKCTSCSRSALIKFSRSLAVSLGRNFVVPKITAIRLKPAKSGSLSEFYCNHCGCSCLNLCLTKSKSFLAKENEERPINCWANKNSNNWKD